MTNEKRLIDANAYPCRHCGHEYCYQNCKDFIRLFNNTVDAVEVVRGRWIKEKLVMCEPYYLCSVCGKLHDQDYNFCNNCGAKMDLED